jgi:ArsR family transcriptional regulator
MQKTLDHLDHLDQLAALADPTRLEICKRVAAEELCVCHLVEDLGMSQPLLSHHLKVLREAGLVDTRRHSYWTYYRLNPEAFARVSGAFLELADRASEPPPARPCN